MNTVLWADAHCHPQDQIGLGAIQEAYESGIKKICCVGLNCAEHEIMLKCKNEYGTKIALGEHPMNDFSNVDWEFLDSVINQYDAIGETGFDFQTPINPQIEAFERHAVMAIKHNLPLVLHIRDAGDGVIENLTIEQLRKFPQLKGVLHCFVGKQKLADFAIQRGFFLSFSGIITFNKSNDLRAVLKTVPLDLLLIETDSPYLAPVPKRGKLNYPMYVRYTGEFISSFLQKPEELISEFVLSNFDRLYSK